MKTSEKYQYKEAQSWVRRRRMLLGLTQRELGQCLVSMFSEEEDALLSAHVRIGEIERGYRKITNEEKKAIEQRLDMVR